MDIVKISTSTEVFIVDSEMLDAPTYIMDDIELIVYALRYCAGNYGITDVESVEIIAR